MRCLRSSRLGSTSTLPDRPHTQSSAPWSDAEIRSPRETSATVSLVCSARPVSPQEAPAALTVGGQPEDSLRTAFLFSPEFRLMDSAVAPRAMRHGRACAAMLASGECGRSEAGGRFSRSRRGARCAYMMEPSVARYLRDRANGQGPCLVSADTRAGCSRAISGVGSQALPLAGWRLR